MKCLSLGQLVGIHDAVAGEEAAGGKFDVAALTKIALYQRLWHADIESHLAELKAAALCATTAWREPFPTRNQDTGVAFMIALLALNGLRITAPLDEIFDKDGQLRLTSLELFSWLIDCVEPI